MLMPPITQETLADIIGTPRSRVSFFMNRFRKPQKIRHSENSNQKVGRHWLLSTRRTCAGRRQVLMVMRSFCDRAI
jgi:hypothetical protein